MPPPCGHDPLDLPPFGEPYTPDRCRACYLYEHDNRYRALWGLQEPPGRPRAQRLPCVHQGEPTGAMVACGTCKGQTSLKVFSCHVHGACTLARAGDEIASCASCSNYQPDTFRLLAPAGTAQVVPRWEGIGSPKPWQYPVSACLPHLNSPELLEVVVALLRAQTVRPYLLVIDTGSTPETCNRLEGMRAQDLEIHYLKGHGWIHSSAPVTAALDTAHALCRTEYLFHTHCDVFPKRRNFLEWLLSQCSAKSPAVGWEMSERSWVTDEWRGLLSHTATMLHMPTVRDSGALWSMEHAHRVLGIGGGATSGWPDTESGFFTILRRAGIPLKILGPEPNFRAHDTEWFTHVRSVAGIALYGGPAAYASAQPALLKQALSQARERLREWQGEWQNSTTLAGR